MDTLSESRWLSQWTIGSTPLLIVVFLAAIVIGLRLISHARLSGSNDLLHQSLPRLEARWYLFGVDTVLQNIHDLRNHNSSNRSLARHRKYGRTYVSTVLGQSTIFTIDPINILSMTSDYFEHWGRGDWVEIIARYMGNGILVNDGSDWHASRTMLKPLFRRNKAADVRLFERHVDGWIEYLRQNAGSFVDFRRAAQMVVLDITTDMLCGRSARSVEDASSKEHRGKELLDLIDDLEPYGNIAIELNVLSLPLFLWDYRKIMGLVRGIQAFFRDAVVETQQKHENSGNREPTIIEQMLLEGLTPNQVQGELQNIFFAAFDTTTALTANLFDCVARDSKHYSRLRAEVMREAGDDGRIDELTISRLVYLRAAIFETLRLHSPVTQHTRKARQDTSLPIGAADNGRLFISKGTVVTWSTYALNRHLHICGDDPDSFRPDRWLENDGCGTARLKSDEGFMPFGSGPRNCLGQQFALQLVTYVSARVLLAFEKMGLERPEREFQEASAVTYYNGLGTRVRFGS